MSGQGHRESSVHLQAYEYALNASAHFEEKKAEEWLEKGANVNMLLIGAADGKNPGHRKRRVSAL